MAQKLKKQMSKLSRRGPHRVMVGDLAVAGLPGKIYTPAEGDGVPGVVFGHDWLTGVDKYHRTLRHLASWGIAVAAPATESGALPDHRGFVADMETCIQILAGVKLGAGKVTVAPGKIGVAGHGMGAGCAILAAADRSVVRAVGALYPAVTSPSCVEAAKAVSAPGLVVGSGRPFLIDAGSPAKVAANWGCDDVVYRVVDKGTQFGFPERIGTNLAIGVGLPRFSAQESARALLTGFLLHQLGHEKDYAAFSDPEADPGKGVTGYTAEELADEAETPVS
ncbi:dienelactone hydrolase family protein [Corynebacterium sp. CCM 8835]|uniref:Dienelactone hydrolase family protein n=1 Tax=Corynebacterium antarcticum TaxID=2800405 RepID=A0A9Q4CEU7_9CORY|nr:dienelactone hydrolase family protein [Corynebacterium antarcticum]MCK7642327.1 dienelactone hydrolase family protein [Corynebacterium antarcticum]MCK7660988.1 dienelactone hydrolase family protein [Corynebacterium antarcticum]MCL0245736.1 dienelactone hydrolase family protein [Corynebacterium antarcticum]MCX7491809.1 dienelactone hydrolase family protein [Corynebacterium antarcticum]MCX7538144.1 dienelactone hydrolase family protein [Corynebacterium antarcticum]